MLKVLKLEISVLVDDNKTSAHKLVTNVRETLRGEATPDTDSYLTQRVRIVVSDTAHLTDINTTK